MIDSRRFRSRPNRLTRHRLPLVGVVLALLCNGGCMSDPFSEEAPPPGRTVIVTVHGEATDWQNAVGRFAAHAADAFGMGTHLTVRSLDELIDRIHNSNLPPIGTLKIWSHGYLGTVHFGRDTLSLETVLGEPHLAVEYDETAVPPRFILRRIDRSEAERRRERLQTIADVLDRTGTVRPRVIIEVCSLGLGRRGRSFVLNLADLLQADIACISGEHLGVRRFGTWVRAAPGESGTNWPTELLPPLANQSPARAYHPITDFAPRQRLADYEPQVKDKFPASVVRVGQWQVREDREDAFGSNYLEADPGSPETPAVWYSFLVPDAGEYDVQIRHPASADAATQVQVEVRHGKGSALHSVNMQQDGGIWKDLGRYRFEPGLWSTATVIIRGGSAEGRVFADAVRLVTPLEATDCYQANRTAIDVTATLTAKDEPTRQQIRQSLTGNVVGMDPNHPSYGRLDPDNPAQEEGATAASKAWRSGRLGRFHEDFRSRPPGKGSPE